MMNTRDRRLEIKTTLNRSDTPIKGTDLAKHFNVSRQVIVQDIALLRAEGESIVATPQGYVIIKQNDDKVLKTVVSKHNTYEEMKDELQIMIDHGVTIVDVIVEHPIYGEIKGVLDISYKEELEKFAEKIRSQKGEPLSTLTEGVHIHTIKIPNEESYNKMKEVLKERGYLIDD